MQHARATASLIRRLAIHAAFGCLLTVAWSGVASARCGDDPGDEAAKAAVRADVEAQCPCAAATDRGSYIRCAKGVIKAAVDGGTLPRACSSAVKRCATKSTCGRPGSVTCCRTTASGKVKCSVKKSADKCKPPRGGTAQTTGCTSCCEACSGGCAPAGTPTATLPPLGTPTGTATATATGTAAATITPTSTPIAATQTATPTITRTPTITATPTLPAICQSVVGLPPIAQIPVTLTEGSSQCGGAGLTNPAPDPPFSGVVADGGGSVIGDLSLGCFYAGGLPPLLLPFGASAEVSVVGLQLLPLALTLGGSDGSGPTDCTRGAGPGRRCANGHPGLDGEGTCNFDGDCGGQLTACALEANCYFGPPIPVPNGPLSACVMNAFLTDLCGQVSLVPPTATFAAALSSRVFLTLDAESPCPRCEGGLCNAGAREGLPCTPLGSAQTSLDCPPTEATFLSTLTAVIPALTSGESTIAASDGFFCDGQSAPGAIGLAAAREVTEQGGGPTLSGLTSLQMSIAGTFCIEATGTFLDSVAGLPAVGALSAGAEVDITDVLFP